MVKSVDIIEDRDRELTLNQGSPLEFQSEGKEDF